MIQDQEHTNLAENIINELEEYLVHIEVILGAGFTEAHSAYSRGKLWATRK